MLAKRSWAWSETRCDRSTTPPWATPWSSPPAQGQALGGEVVVSQDVKAAVETRFELEAREPVQVKGLSQPVLCYAVKREFKMPAQASGVAHFQ